MSIDASFDPDQPGEAGWVYVGLRRPSERSPHLDAMIGLWKLAESVVVVVTDGPEVIEEVRAGPVDFIAQIGPVGTGFLLRERDHTTDSQYLRLNAPRRQALNRALEHLYRGIDFDVDLVAGMSTVETWRDEVNRIARASSPVWRETTVTFDAPPATSTVNGWRWHEIIHLDDRGIAMVGGGSLPRVLAHFERRDAFLRASDRDSGQSLHVFWGDGANQIEVVISSQPDDIAGSDASFLLEPAGIVRRSTAGGRVTVIASPEISERALADLDLESMVRSQSIGPIRFPERHSRRFIA